MPMPFERHPQDMPPTHSGEPFNALDYVSLVLLVIGGLNWGLVALFDFDLVAGVFGDMTDLARAAYLTVAAAAVYGMFMLARQRTG